MDDAALKVNCTSAPRHVFSVFRLALKSIAVRIIPWRQSLLFDPKGPKRIIYYPGGNGWSLSFVWQGLVRSKSAASVDGFPELCECDSLLRLKKLFRSANAFVFVVAGRHVAEVLRAGVPPGRIIYYFPHVGINKNVPRIKALHAVLTQNRFEYHLALIRGVSAERVHLFPAGLDRGLFPDLELIPDEKCDIDVLFVGSCYSSDKPWVRIRKGHYLQLELMNRLASLGYRVAVLGPGWNAEGVVVDERIRLLDLPYSSYFKLMRSSRLLCSTAVQEGGPLSFPEGLASGCSMLSHMTGFSLEFVSGVEGIWHMPLGSAVEEWVERIGLILRQGRPSVWPVSGVREKFLQAADYEHLAGQLLEICFPKHVD